MKVEKSTVTKVRLSELDKLDPITVILENYEPGKGKIIIECYGKSWSSFWPAMSGRSVEQFFIDCGEDYLANNLQSMQSHIDDEDAVQEMIWKAVLKSRRNGDISEFDAREIWENASIEMLKDGLSMVDFDVCQKLFEGPWYEISFPQKLNPSYVYLCRIIVAVQQGLKEYIGMKEAA
ncbi:conserved hypothetical protein [Tolumonas auensis DSM 9187]|uniref:Uncharacterized protein n=1 Tax=Tolumonas auensis (strain DSM 9187 / NBRC 110442 / TA 4) TaxID=595494 RepID=C4LBB7_TOLAT|nr:hypothetical protein [Tolumonas auensis]ACQ92352.1 conserved hypothetical protein [Tolumonas auensis DSM 9187]